MKRQVLSLVTAALLVAFGTTGCKRPERSVEAAREPSVSKDQSATITAADRDFMRKASENHMKEIDLARLAEQKSQKTDVKDFARMLQNDHKAALKNLTTIMDK